LPAPTTRRSLRRAQRPRALSDKGLSLYNLDRKEEPQRRRDQSPAAIAARRESLDRIGAEIAAMPILDPRSPNEIVDDLNAL
jgi:hypothetical protein